MEKNNNIILDQLKDKIKFIEYFYTFLGWFLFIIVNSIQLIIIPIIFILTFPFDRDRKIISYLVKFFCMIFYILNFVERNHVDYNNIKAPKKGERVIYIINHASLFDVILMFLLPGPVKSIMKESYSKIPVIGWIAVLTGNMILPESSSDENIIGIYLKLKEKLERGVPVAIFPEGTKSKNSKIGRFYNGSFKLAVDTKADIIPVIFDTWNIIRPGGLWIRDVNVHIKLLNKIKYNEFKDIDYKKLAKFVKIKMLEELIKLRDERRLKSKKYYRNLDKYKKLDSEMKEELLKLKNEIKNL